MCFKDMEINLHNINKKYIILFKDFFSTFSLKICLISFNIK